MVWTLSTGRQRTLVSGMAAARTPLRSTWISDTASSPQLGRTLATANLALVGWLITESLSASPLEASTTVAAAFAAATTPIQSGAPWLLALAVTTSVSLLLLAARATGRRQTEPQPAVAAPALKSAPDSGYDIGQRPDGTVADLMAQMSHDLRTPLNAIIGFSDIMHRELLGPLGSERYHGYAADIRESGVTLLKSVEDTLALTKLLAGSERAATAPVCLTTALGEACRTMAATATDRRITLQRIEADDLHVAAEAQALRQALINLVAAGIALAPDGGTLRLTTASVGAEVQLAIEAQRPVAGAAAAPTSGQAHHASLSIAIARTLVTLQRGELAEHRDAAGSLRALVASLPGCAA